MSFSVKIDRAVVYERENGTDIVEFVTGYSSPMVLPDGSRAPGELILRFATTRGYGVEYVRTIYGVEPEVRQI